MEFMEFSAKTVNDCITEACQKFGVTSDKLEYEQFHFSLFSRKEFVTIREEWGWENTV